MDERPIIMGAAMAQTITLVAGGGIGPVGVFHHAALEELP